MFMSAVYTDRIVPIGKLLLNANLGLDNTPGTVFLLKDSRLPDGVMFAISAYYRSHKPVRVQVWRPTNSTSVYKLVWEHRFESPVVGVRQDVSCLSIVITCLMSILSTVII